MVTKELRLAGWKSIEEPTVTETDVTFIYAHKDLPSLILELIFIIDAIPVVVVATLSDASGVDIEEWRDEDISVDSIMDAADIYLGLDPDEDEE